MPAVPGSAKSADETTSPVTAMVWGAATGKAGWPPVVLQV